MTHPFPTRRASDLISQGAAEVCLEGIQKANEKGITVSCDLNFRKNLWKYGKAASEVMPDLVAGCDVILGNEEDAEKVFGIHPEGADVTSGHVEAEGYESVCRQMMKRFPRAKRSEEHTSELQSLMRISYAAFCLKKNNNQHTTRTNKK